MKPNSLYAQLELITDPQDDQGHNLWRDRSSSTDYSIGRVWARVKADLGLAVGRLLTYLCGSNDLRVTMGRDRQGNTWFVAHDPVTQQRHTFSSEQDLRVWVDQRYYR